MGGKPPLLYCTMRYLRKESGGSVRPWAETAFTLLHHLGGSSSWSFLSLTKVPSRGGVIRIWGGGVFIPVISASYEGDIEGGGVVIAYLIPEV